MPGFGWFVPGWLGLAQPEFGTGWPHLPARGKRLRLGPSELRSDPSELRSEPVRAKVRTRPSYGRTKVRPVRAKVRAPSELRANYGSEPVTEPYRTVTEPVTEARFAPLCI